MQLVIQEEMIRRETLSPNRTSRESLIWDMISENILSSYRNELNWIQKTRNKLADNQLRKKNNILNYQIRKIDNKKYIEIISSSKPLNTENDALDLIALCSEHNTNILMIHYAALSEDFFNLKTKAAGNIIQKFINYCIKTVAVVPGEIIQKGRLKEMTLETNKGNHFRMYENKEKAEKWLIQ